MKVGIQMVFQSYGYGPSVADAERSMCTFAAEVLPELRRSRAAA